jgi:hypothetical protein
VRLEEEKKKRNVREKRPTLYTRHKKVNVKGASAGPHRSPTNVCVKAYPYHFATRVGITMRLAWKRIGTPHAAVAAKVWTPIVGSRRIFSTSPNVVTEEIEVPQ